MNQRRWIHFEVDIDLTDEDGAEINSRAQAEAKLHQMRKLARRLGLQYDNNEEFHQ